ncbi:MAG TPA: L,D-transpeptidase [Desulfomonilaceae bacterium]|nr:L,D-transpeptidase [Desulfomonilaceae bacterium]
MCRTSCVLLGMGLVLILSLSSPLFAAESGSASPALAASHTGPAVAPPDAAYEPPGSEDVDEDVPGPALVSPKEMNTLLKSSASLQTIGALSKDSASADSYLDIEVSHSQHIFKLYAYGQGGKRDLLYECRVGLGAPEFPTPVGVYYVTHIYDEDPWWIPPKDRAWAAGDSPSRRVYGGTMAPLLKKRPVRQKKQIQQPEQEDLISYEVQLDDYGYRFHGTNAPRSIGRNQSHGCVRMLSADAKKVATLIKNQVGLVERKESENGTFVVLKSPVRLNLVK